MRDQIASAREAFFAALGTPTKLNSEEWECARKKARELARAYQEAPTGHSWRALWTASIPFVGSVCWRYWDEKCQHGRFVDDPLDLVGEVYLRARRYAESWREEAGDWSTWLQNKARWDLTDLHRTTCKARQLQRRGRELVTFEDFDECAAPFESPEDQAEIAEEFDRVSLALQKLGSRQHDIILRWSACEELKRIGASWGISESRTSQLVKIALTDLYHDPFIQSQRVGPPLRRAARRAPC